MFASGYPESALDEHFVFVARTTELADKFVWEPEISKSDKSDQNWRVYSIKRSYDETIWRKDVVLASVCAVESHNCHSHVKHSVTLGIEHRVAK